MSASGRPVRVAVVGAGTMGSNHARVYSSLKGIELVAVVDTAIERARRVADLHGGIATDRLSDLRGIADAASVAVPSSDHERTSLQLFDLGLDCLIEKPIAPTVAAAERLIAAARHSGRALLVGHVERFNPAVEELGRILSDGPAVLALDAQRMSSVSSRIIDVDVVTDLMIHDLDIMLELMRGDDIVDVAASGVTAGGRNGSDYVAAMLMFSSGSLATVTASRVTQNQIRQLRVTTEDRLFSIDYPSQELLIHRQGRIGSLDDDDLSQGRYVLDVGTERVFVRRSEPLAAELRHFADVVRREAEPRVSGAEALRSLELAVRIRELAVREPA